MKKALLLSFALLLTASLLAGSPAALTPTQMTSQVLNRLTFGPRTQDYLAIEQLGIKGYIDQQLDPDKINDGECDQLLNQIPDLSLSPWELYKKYPPAQVVIRNGVAQKKKRMTEKEQKGEGQRIRTILREMTAAKLTRLLYSKRQLQEVMVDFWFNHFNITFQKNRDKWLLPSYEQEVIRPHAMGKFRDLLGAVAHSPAMLEYLDNVVSTVDKRYVPEADMSEYPAMAAMEMAQASGKPRKNFGLNENYARELLELHTVGVDSGYTQNDIIELARVMTGWSFDGPYFSTQQSGKGKRKKNNDPNKAFHFTFRANMHDHGDKTVLGQKFGPDNGEAEGEAVLDMLCKQPATAHFIAAKLCRRFISDNPPESVVKAVADTFLKTDGDIRSCLRTIFDSPEFTAPEAYRAKVKTPLEFVASAMRVTGAQLIEPEKLLRVFNLMGEPPYLCEPPTGYPDTAAAWVNSGALLDRLNFGLLLLSNKPNSPGKVDLSGLDESLRSGNDGEKILNGFFRVFLKDQVSENTRTVLMKKLADPDVSHAMLDDRRQNYEAAQLGALVLGSPDFQRR